MVSAIGKVPNGAERAAPGKPPRGETEGCVRGATKGEMPGAGPGIGADATERPELFTAEEACDPATLHHNFCQIQ